VRESSTPERGRLEAVWRIESPALIAGLARIVRDVGVAEDLAQDALVAALEQWPLSGVPDNPGAWLMATAKHRAIDLLRRGSRLERKQQELARELELRGDELAPALERPVEEQVGDDVLCLMLMCCHPGLSEQAQVTLTLRMLGGLSTQEIARAYLTSESTVAQRIVRAKRTLAEADLAFELPSGGDLQDRLSSVLGVLYLIFNEGYSASSGEDWVRSELCQEALRLGRILAGLAPEQAEVHGLLALMEIQASRLSARVGPGGEPVLIGDQDRSRWDRMLIRRGLASLARAEALERTRGPYTLQAAIAACHARARAQHDTDWVRVTALYDELARTAPSPVVELNRAVAVASAHGPQAGIEILDALTEDPLMQGYHLLPSVRADLLARLGRFEEAQDEVRRAASLAQNAPERRMLLDRASAYAWEAGRRGADQSPQGGAGGSSRSQ
jgi:RNA polymerase sigma factor (sigma-70 family)